MCLRVVTGVTWKGLRMKPAKSPAPLNRIRKRARLAAALPTGTTANGCFKKVNQNGATSPMPAADPGWAMEISLDLDMVSATCPDCKILLVEASSPDTDPLMKGVDTAVNMGAVAVSNSYGG